MNLDREAPSDLRIKRPPAQNLVGAKYGRLSVRSYLGFSRASWSSYWQCDCDCGRRIAVRQKAMTRSSKPTRSCGCIAAESASARQWRGCGELSHHYWNGLRHHALERGLPFDISIEDGWRLYLQQDRRCALSGLAIAFGRYRPASRAHGKWPRLGTASLDRKDSDKGYSADNVQWVHKEINRMKGTLADPEFIELCTLVAGANQHPPGRPEAAI